MKNNKILIIGHRDTIASLIFNQIAARPDNSGLIIVGVGDKFNPEQLSRQIAMSGKDILLIEPKAEHMPTIEKLMQEARHIELPPMLGLIAKAEDDFKIETMAAEFEKKAAPPKYRLFGPRPKARKAFPTKARKYYNRKP